MSNKNDKGWFGFSEWTNELKKSREELRKTNELLRLSCWVSLAFMVATVIPGGFILVAIFCWWWWQKRYRNRNER